MELIQMILCGVLTVVFMILFHACFSRIYFHGICAGLLQELLVSFFLAGLVTAFLTAIASSVLGWIGSVLLFLLKAALWIAGIGAVLYGAYVVYEKFIKKE